ARNTTTRLPCNGRPASSTRRTSCERMETPSARSDGEPRTALPPAGGEDRATGPRPHPVAEPLHLPAGAVVRLVGALALGHGRNDPRSTWSAGVRPAGA